MNRNEARAAWQQDRSQHEALGVHLPMVASYLPAEYRHNVRLAMDAQPELVTDPNSGVPFFLTSFIDPEVIRVRFSPSNAAKILGEQKKGTWVDTTAMFTLVEHTGEVSSYGDRNENGRAGLNTNWPQRQQYLYQAVKDIGDLELERAGLAKINYVAEVDMAAGTVMAKFENLTYFYGVAGLQNYGLLNDPSLSAALTPAVKAGGGVKWFNNSGALVATANEVYNDIVAIFYKLVSQTSGLVSKDDSIVLAMSPGSEVALTATNTFNVNVSDLLKKNFKNIRIQTAVQYGAKSADNPQGNAAGNLVQMFAESVDGTKTGFSAFSEKLRSHPIVRKLSSFQQKMTGGTWGSVLRMPMAVAQMVGV